MNNTIYKKTSEYDELKQTNQQKIKECRDLTAKLSEKEHLNSNLNKDLTDKTVENKALTAELNKKSTQNTVLTLDRREKTMELTKIGTEMTEKLKLIKSLNDEKEELENKVRGDIFIIYDFLNSIDNIRFFFIFIFRSIHFVEE